MSQYPKLKIRMQSGDEAELSFQGNVIMLHSSDICAQWSPDCVGLRVTKEGDGILRLAFTTISKIDVSVVENYQSFYIAAGHWEDLKRFFKNLRFTERSFEDHTQLIEALKTPTKLDS